VESEFTLCDICNLETLRSNLLTNRYGFSATSSVTISEFLKFLLSSFFFWREFKRRGGAQQLNQDTPLASGSVSLEDIEEGKERARQSEDLSFEEEDPLHGIDKSYVTQRSTFYAFVQAAREEIPVETRFGFAHLALFYVLINNIVSSRHIDGRF
jgi:hypothetical protein